jgi:hypothetical protein
VFEHLLDGVDADHLEHACQVGLVVAEVTR